MRLSLLILGCCLQHSGEGGGGVGKLVAVWRAYLDMIVHFSMCQELHVSGQAPVTACVEIALSL